MISRVERASIAARAGLRVADRRVAVDGPPAKRSVVTLQAKAGATGPDLPAGAPASSQRRFSGAVAAVAGIYSRKFFRKFSVVRK